MTLEELELSETHIKKLNKKNIFCAEDILYLFPRKYYDFRSPALINPGLNGKEVGIEGVLKSIVLEKDRVKNIYILKAKIFDKVSENIILINWFGAYYLKDTYRQWVGQDVYCCGKVHYHEIYGYSITNPMIFTNDLEKYKCIYPVYSKFAGISDEYMATCRYKCFQRCDLTDFLSESLLKEIEHRIQDRQEQIAVNLFDNIYNMDKQCIEKYSVKLLSLKDAFYMIHAPKSADEIAQARLRFLYNDLLYLASKLELEARESSVGSVYGLKTLKHTYQFIDSLPYHLTDDQYHIFHIFSEQMRIGKRINSLIQGDVGCGKTIVAYIAMFMAADSGYQSVLLAPTNVLARQHYNDLRIYSEKYGYKAAFLNGSLKAAEKKKILKEIHNGDYDFIVGTHSVFSKNVEYQNLALIVTDEEHKFGVKQRIALESKAKVGVHTISMSATPIPRSLAQTLYGGLKDVYNINTVPNGRKEIRSQIFQNNAGSFKFIYNEIKKGRQAYVVCKYVEESEKNTVVSVKDAYADLCDFFKNTDVKIGIVTGKTNKSEADATLTAFKNNEINILVATTIVEVGVNVPNASVIMIYDADMYGLSQLHQLRGRVGRGNEQGYCILNTGVDEITHTYREVPERLEFFCTTTDGFKIAAEDLKFRGAGDLIGTKQSGFNKYIDKMLCNPILYSTIKETIKKMADYGICNEVIENFERNEREV